MKDSNKQVILSDEAIGSKIYFFRGQKVLLDADLAEMYGVETRRLNEQVKRNSDRFPEDFMFQLTEKEFEVLISQNATSRWGGRRKKPYAFTEHGVLMLSSILNSPIAIQVNIRIMRVYTKLREMIFTHKDILLKLEQIEKKMLKQEDHLKKHEEELQTVFATIKKLLSPNQSSRNQIGFKKK